MCPKAEHLTRGRSLVANHHERRERLPRLTGNRSEVGECRVVRFGVCGVEKPPAPNEQLLTTTVPEGDPKVGVSLTTIVGAAHEKQAEEAIALPVMNRRDADLELVLAAGRQRVASFIH